MMKKSAGKTALPDMSQAKNGKKKTEKWKIFADCTQINVCMAVFKDDNWQHMGDLIWSLRETFNSRKNKRENWISV